MRESSFIFRPKARLSAFAKSCQVLSRASISSKEHSHADFVSQQPTLSSSRPLNYLDDSPSMRAGICGGGGALPPRSIFVHRTQDAASRVSHTRAGGLSVL